jgi:hypothetical protein
MRSFAERPRFSEFLKSDSKEVIPDWSVQKIQEV